MKRGKHPTTSRRKKRQRVKERLAKAIHDAQLADVIPMQPAGVLRSDRVPPSAQSESTDHMELVAVAARNNWATPDEVKPKIVDNLAKIATGGGGETVLDEDGVAISTGPSLKTQVYAAKVLTEIDQIQYERDHPEEAGKAKGGAKVAVGVTVNNEPVTDIGDLIRAARQQRDVGKVKHDKDESKAVDQGVDAPAAGQGGERQDSPGGLREGSDEVLGEGPSDQEHRA